MKRTWRDGLAL